MRYRLESLAALVAFLAWSCSPSSEPDFPQADDGHPYVSIAAPADGAVFSQGDTVLVDVVASDPDGVITAVRLYANGRYSGVDSTSPYQIRWDTRGEVIGSTVLLVVAEDDEGLIASRSIGVTITWGYFPPQRLNDGWDTSTLGAEGFDTTRIKSMMNGIHTGDHDYMRAVLIARNGRLVFEEYFAAFERDSLQHIQSATKSITSALVGIAVDRGEIGGVDDRMADHLRGYAPLFDEEKESITIEHCLMMAAGLEWNEHSIPYSDPSNDNTVGNRSMDYVAYVLSKPVVQEPGTVWYYNSGCSMTLGAILRNATGLRADEYAEQCLFGSLGISHSSWELMGSGHVATHGGLHLRPRDMAKFGQLFLQRGAWDGEQIISEQWVTESTRPRLTVSGDIRYGYQWWLKQMNGYDVPMAAGGGGQYIFVVAELGLVAVTAADPRYSDSTAVQEQRMVSLFETQILPAVL